MLGNKMPLNSQKSNQQGKVTLSISSNGFEFDYSQERWILNRNTTVNLDFLSLFDDPVAEDIREALVHIAENHSGGHVSAITKQLKFYLKATNESCFSASAFLSLKGSLQKDSDYKLSTIRGFIRSMRYLGLNNNIDDAVYKLTDQWRLSAGPKGVPVLSLDPETGPFSNTEFEAIGAIAAQKYAEEVLSTEGYALILLFKATGRRTEQLATLKIKDFSITRKFTGNLTYVINIPRAKQQNGRYFRHQFKIFGLVNYVGQVIEQHIKESIEIVEARLNRKLSSIEQNELPLFVTTNVIDTMESFKSENMHEFLRSELSHIRSASLGKMLIAAVEKLKVVSERTGQLIHVNPYRFRYSLGTRAAIEGAGTLTIATLLDHSDTQHVAMYVANVPEFAIEISKIMNQPLARYAAAFAGKLVKNEEEANKKNAGATRIPLREKDADLGSCGTNSFCQDYAPIACYLCPKFMPWEDAPHHLVLEWLMEEREQLKVDTGGDMEIVAINDRAIIAVCQVIKLCEEKKHV